MVALHPQQGPHPGQELGLVERFAQEVIRSRLEPLDLVFGLARRDHDDGQVGGGRVGPEPAADLVAVHARHENVEEDEVRSLLLDQREGFRPRRGRYHDVTV